jgi:hypothetical protein
MSHWKDGFDGDVDVDDVVSDVGCRTGGGAMLVSVSRCQLSARKMAGVERYGGN